MRSSYRPRDPHSNSNHGFRGSGRGGGGGRGGAAASSSSSRVTAPRPVQTSSLKAESGVFDLTTVLVPAASKEKGGTWGRAAAPIAEARLPPASTSTPSAPALSPNTKLLPSRDAAASPTSSERSTSPEAGNGNRGPVNEASAEADPAAAWDNPSLSNQTPYDSSTAFRRDVSRDGRSAVPAPKREPDVGFSPSLTSASSTAAPLSDELFPPLGHTEPIEKRSSGFDHSHRAEALEVTKGAAAASRAAFVLSDATPAPSAFQTPSPDEADTEEEKERRRRSLALEQQRLILEQVEAARAAAKASNKIADPGHPKPPPRKKVSVIMRRASDQKDEVVRPAVAKAATPAKEQPNVTRKGPRTQGKLYTRRPDGCLVEASSGEALPETDEEDFDGTPDEKDHEAPKDATPDDSKTGSENTPHPKKGKSSAKKKWGSKNRRPKKHQVAAVVES